MDGETQLVRDINLVIRKIEDADVMSLTHKQCVSLIEDIYFMLNGIVM